MCGFNAIPSLNKGPEVLCLKASFDRETKSPLTGKLDVTSHPQASTNAFQLEHLVTWKLLPAYLGRSRRHWHSHRSRLYRDSRCKTTCRPSESRLQFIISLVLASSGYVVTPGATGTTTNSNCGHSRTTSQASLSADSGGSINMS